MDNANAFTLIRRWADARNLIDGSTPQAQFVKLAEEMGELAAGLAKNRPGQAVDSIGDMVVVLTILAEQLGVTIEGCILTAWDEIKDRTGRMENGVFIKDGD